MRRSSADFVRRFFYFFTWPRCATAGLQDECPGSSKYGHIYDLVYRPYLLSRIRMPSSGSRSNSVMRSALRRSRSPASFVGCIQRRSQITLGGGPTVVALANSHTSRSGLSISPASATCMDPGKRSLRRETSLREVFVEQQLHSATRLPRRDAKS